MCSTCIVMMLIRTDWTVISPCLFYCCLPFTVLIMFVLTGILSQLSLPFSCFVITCFAVYWFVIICSAVLLLCYYQFFAVFLFCYFVLLFLYYLFCCLLYYFMLWSFVLFCYFLFCCFLYFLKIFYFAVLLFCYFLFLPFFFPFCFVIIWGKMIGSQMATSSQIWTITCAVLLVTNSCDKYKWGSHHHLMVHPPWKVDYNESPF